MPPAEIGPLRGEQAQGPGVSAAVEPRSRFFLGRFVDLGRLGCEDSGSKKPPRKCRGLVDSVCTKWRKQIAVKVGLGVVKMIRFENLTEFVEERGCKGLEFRKAIFQ